MPWYFSLRSKLLYTLHLKNNELLTIEKQQAINKYIFAQSIVLIYKIVSFLSTVFLTFLKTHSFYLKISNLRISVKGHFLLTICYIFSKLF